jgi:hypothetical protein
MSDSESLLFKDPDTGEEYTILFAAPDGTTEAPEDGSSWRNQSVIDMQKVQKQLRGYALFCMGAFRQFPVANIEEMTVKFNVKIGGQSGIPFLVKGSMDYDFGIEVKCKFPDQPAPPPAQPQNP